MQRSEFNFPFDPSLIAAEPVLPRDHARLMILSRSSRSCIHKRVAELPDLLRKGDLLIVNDTKVRAARVSARRRPSGTPVDVLFVKEIGERTWEVLMKGKWRPGNIIEVDSKTTLRVEAREESRTIVRIEGTVPSLEFFMTHGQMPLPPYIKRNPTERDRTWYQTVFAREEGAIAAPTAGLHFTPELLARLAERGVGLSRVTLHVGIGTFKPVTVDCIEDHRMAAEWVDIEDETVRAIERARKAGSRVIAIGTTVVRALESATDGRGCVNPYRGETNLFIKPGYVFRTADALLTNFHLPETTLLMLVSAFVGVESLRSAYEEAVRERYRFYSYGDAMLIL
ncbi:tRNA preQ1(34) S-adenosylmethionine ribosyltransferase-isomerase QueA [Petrachloros mirabilis]